MNTLEKWTSISLINLGIVAILGFLMRSKLMFSLPAINFKYTLHAHSHFAFGGWVSLALMALMTYQLLPSKLYNKAIYRWMLAAILLNALGMLVSFLCQGYGAVSIAFSTAFILVTYVFAYIFIKDILKAPPGRSVRMLAIISLVCLVLSSIGPYTLAYLLASRSPNLVLYKDAIYTYLHLQYNGFFTLAVFSLMLNRLSIDHGTTKTFAKLLSFSVVPSMFMSYLWHYPSVFVRIMAMAGTLLLVAAIVSYFIMMLKLKTKFSALPPPVRTIGTMSMMAFVLKMIFQSLTIIPSLGPLVFANRPVIIGFLHLVLLGFVSLYLIASFIHDGLLVLTRLTLFGLRLFVAGILLNEMILMAQGLGFMFMMSSVVMHWLLWIAAICLMAGAMVLAGGNITKLKVSLSGYRRTTPFYQS